MAARHTGPLDVAPAGAGTSTFLHGDGLGLEPLGAWESPPRPLCSAHPAHLSLVTVPRTAPEGRAGLATMEAAVLMATAGTAETAREAGAGLALLGAVLAASGGTATARAEVASAGAGLAARWALRGRRGL